MGDTDLQPSKKRAAGRQLSRDNPGLDDEESSEQETGTFKKASDEVLASRRIVKVRRNNAMDTAPSSNPFAGIRLAPPTNTQTTPGVASTEAESGETVLEKDEKKNDAEKELKENDKKSEGDDVSEANPEPTNTQTTPNVVSTENESGKYIQLKDEKKNDAEKESKENDKQSEGDDVSEANPEPIAESEKTDEVINLEESKTVDKKTTEGDKSDEEDKEDAEAKKGDGGGRNCTQEASENKVVENIEMQANKDEDNMKTAEVEKKGDDEDVEKSADTSSFSSFQQLSSNQNAFTGLAGTGFSSSTFSFGSITNNGSGPLFGKDDLPPVRVAKNEFGGTSVIREFPIETGEENEKAVFTADSVLFEFLDGGWKERGKGALKVNVSTAEDGKARLIMRTKGNYRLVLNASLYPDMKLTNMERKGITFACINSASEGKDGLSTYALKFKDASIVDEFRAAVTEHKGKSSSSLQATENSPKASDN